MPRPKKVIDPQTEFITEAQAKAMAQQVEEKAQAQITKLRLDYHRQVQELQQAFVNSQHDIQEGRTADIDNIFARVKKAEPV